MNKNIENEIVEKQQQFAIVEEDEDGMSVPNWLIDVLKWITRIEMANSSLSFSCKLFNRLCWPKLHGNLKAHIVLWLEFFDGRDNFGNHCGILNRIDARSRQILPIASTPPPEYILAFGQITIRFLDTQIIEFVRNIGLKKIYLSFIPSTQKLQQNDEQLSLLGNLLTILANNIYSFHIFNFFDVDRFWNFNRQFPTFIDQLPYLNLDNITALDFDILFDWLMKPLTNGRQKILYYCFKFVQIEQQREMEFRFFNRIKEEFLHSTKRNNFLVELRQEFDKFNLQNEQTEEVLNLYQEMDAYGIDMHNFLVRYPNGDKEHWKENNVEKITNKGNTNIQLEY